MVRYFIPALTSKLRYPFYKNPGPEASEFIELIPLSSLQKVPEFIKINSKLYRYYIKTVAEPKKKKIL